MRLQKNLDINLGQNYRRENIDNYEKIENDFNWQSRLLELHKHNDKVAHDSKQISYNNSTLDSTLNYFYWRVRNLVIGIDGDGVKEVTDSRVAMDNTTHGVLSERLEQDYNNTQKDIEHVHHQLVEINLDEYYPDKTGKQDASRQIQDALNRIRNAGGGILYIPSGVYLCTGRMYIYSNTTVKMEDNTILLRGHEQGFFDNGNPLDERVLYEGEHNIKIIGGVLDNNLEQIDKYPTKNVNMLNLRHAKNIHIDGVTFKNSISHHCIDVNGSKDLVIQNCVFEGYKNLTGETDKEAIQIAEYKEGGINGGKFDGTRSKDIIIRYNKFRRSNLAGGFEVCIGNHSTTHDVYEENIEISHNDFRDCTTAIRSFKWKNLRVLNNIFQDLKYGVRISAVGGEYLSASDINGIPTGKCQGTLEHEIRGNSFRNFNIAVGTYGRYYRGNFGYNEHIKITENYFMGEDRNKALPVNIELSKDIHIANNIFSESFRGVQVMASHYLHIKNNHFTGMRTEGMYIVDSKFPGEANNSSHVHVSGNTLDFAGKNGIFLQNVEVFSIKENDINNTNSDTIEDGSLRGAIKVYDARNGIVSQNFGYGSDQEFVVNIDVATNVVAFNNAGTSKVTVTNAKNSGVGYYAVDKDNKIKIYETEV